ncbi:DUF5677 domain-containing protein [Baekduia sp.]|jgi:hypothetical protein|uniref:DUF5677 domain-containing protein n=1 Tax=Baekduia sp. TaxID=2600305 RepID=UPI002E015122|nr:DUF5677 domain-containing protein [Baekduia sp.]
MTEMIQPAREAIAQRFAVLLTACDGLRDYAISVKSPWSGRPLNDEARHELMLAVIFSRSLSTYWSAVELARTGFGPQAAMLNRSLFEDMVDAHWISVEPELAVERIHQHHQHGRMLLADAVVAQGVVSRAEVPRFDADERAALDKIFGDYGERSWTGLGIYARVMAVEHLWEPVEGGRELLHFYRRLVHRENNQLLHLSSFSMGEQVRGQTDTELALALGPSSAHVEKALIAAYWCFGQLISLIRDTFGLGDTEGWRAVYDTPLRDVQSAKVRE